MAEGDPAPQLPAKDFTFCDGCGGLSVLTYDEEGNKKFRRVGRMMTRWGNLKNHGLDIVSKLDNGESLDTEAELRKIVGMIMGTVPLVGPDGT